MSTNSFFNIKSILAATAILMAIYSAESMAYVRPGEPQPRGDIRPYPGERDHNDRRDMDRDRERERDARRPYPSDPYRPGPVRPGPVRPEPVRPLPPPPPPPVCYDSSVINSIDSMNYKIDRVSNGKCAGYDKWTVRNCADNLESHAVDSTKAALRNTLRDIQRSVENICRDRYNCSYYESDRVLNRYEDLLYRLKRTDMVYDHGYGRTSIIDDVDFFRAYCR